jgi:Mg-chelatase subunit ChlI
MERKDQEIRMLSVRLPPYNYIMGRNLERIGNATIEEDFVEELRFLKGEDLSNRLNSSEMAVRVRPAADMLCFIALVDHVIKRTPFRKELRMLRINQSIEEFYRSTSDLQEARHQAESFMNRRLRRMFPDMSTDESNEIKQRGAEMIDAIEQKILEERRAEVEAQRQKTEEASAASKGTQDEGGDGVEDDLTEEEKAHGVFLGRVEMRVAGNYRRVHYKIMPDEEEPERFIIVQCNPDTDELVPQMRRGAKRFVEKDTRDGVWKVV